MRIKNYYLLSDDAVLLVLLLVLRDPSRSVVEADRLLLFAAVPSDSSVAVHSSVVMVND
jgi:hypothetical protein